MQQGPILVLLGVGCVILGIFLCLSNHKMMQDIQARKMRYKSFSNLSPSKSLSVLSISQHCEQFSSQNEGVTIPSPTTNDSIACFPTPDEDIGGDKLSNNPDVKVELVDDVGSIRDGLAVLRIPSSRRSSYHGCQINFEEPKLRPYSPTLLDLNSKESNRRSSQELDSPVAVVDT